MRLSHLDFDALQRTILELYAHRDMAAFRRAAPTLLLKIIPGEYFVLFDADVNLATRRIRVLDHWETAPVNTRNIIERMERVGFHHPFTQAALKTGDPGALKFSDFFSLRELRESMVYREFYAHVPVERLLGIGSLSGTTLTTLNVSRRARDRDFTERDRLVLNLLRPHFVQARRNAERITALLGAEAKPLAVYGLTPREAEIARWLARGKTNSEIALILQIRLRTVEKHMEGILGKLGVENRTTAAVTLAQSSDA